MPVKMKNYSTPHKNQHRPSRKLQRKWINKKALEQLKKKKHFRRFSLKMPKRIRVFYHDNRFKFPCVCSYANEKDRKHDICLSKIPQEHIYAYNDFKDIFYEYSRILNKLYYKITNTPKAYIDKGYLNYVETGWIYNPHQFLIKPKKSKKISKTISYLESFESSIFQAYSSYKYNI